MTGTPAQDASGAPKIRVLIVEDHAMVAEALAATLDQEPGLHVVGWLASLADLRAYLPATDAPNSHDVAIVDYYLPDGDGLDAAYLLGHSAPGAAVILVSASRVELDLIRAIEAGCIAFVDKRSRVEDLLRAIRAAVRGEASFDAGLLLDAMRASVAPNTGPGETSAGALSEREREVLRLLAAGQSTEAMAGYLYLSQHTVRNHIRSLSAKLGAHWRLEAVAIAARVGLVELIPPPEQSRE